MPASVEVRDRGWDKLSRAFRQQGRAKDPHVVVGLRGNGPAAGPHGTGGPSIVELGTIHEFGLGPMPMRSFIRGGIDANAKPIEALTNKLAKRVLGGTLSVRGALDLIGDKAKGRIQAFMAKGIAPDKADGDKARLIDTGQLRSSIDHEVRIK